MIIAATTLPQQKVQGILMNQITKLIGAPLGKIFFVFFWGFTKILMMLFGRGPSDM
jgi:uncharacterized membrane protein YeaQ/YmgE (transglycosylase-associated protein family)